MDCSLPGSSIHGIFQARVLEWGAIAFSYLLLVKHQNHTCQCLGWFLCQKIGKFPCALVTKPNLGLPTQSSTAKPIYWHQIVVKGSTTLMQDTNKSMGSKCSKDLNSQMVSSEEFLKVRWGRGSRVAWSTHGQCSSSWLVMRITWCLGTLNHQPSGSSWSGIYVLVGSNSLLPPDGSFQYMLRILSIAHEEELKVLDFVS